MAQRKRHRLKVKNIVVAVLILLIAIAGLTAGIVALTSRGAIPARAARTTLPVPLPVQNPLMIRTARTAR